VEGKDISVKKGSSKRSPPNKPSITVAATPRVMSALPPKQSTKNADVQGKTTSRTARSVTGTKRNIDGIALRGLTKAPVT
tara:strand:+ start:224 stop:463 length:240 start_codon:yes stop_codon:yes gene_type:complete